MLNLFRFGVMFCCAMFLGAAQAEAPMAKTQVPGYYRFMVGQFEVTALFDGAIQLDTKLLKNTKPTELQKLLASMFVGNPKMQTAVNAYLVNTGSHLVLVDTGAAKLFGPTLGFVLENLKAAGYAPEQVDAVLLTHLHGDHAGGLLDASAQPVFQKAKVFVAQEENDFWLSKKQADAAPEAMKPHFKRAVDLAAPYQAQGRWSPFAAGAELVPGVRSVSEFGHTPGHSGYLLESKGQKLLIWGDVVHAHAVQFAKPEVAIEFDVNSKQAVVTRKALMQSMASEGTLVAGAHLPFPGVGHVRADGKGRFSWVPVEFSPMP